MITPVTYSGRLLAKVRDFENLPLSKMDASYWDRTHDGELQDVKELIKGHYLVAQDYTCPYCKQRVEVKHKAAWDAEHIVPKASHPQFMFVPENLCIACKDCNRIKWNKSVLRNEKRVTFSYARSDYTICHPHFDVYENEIKIIEVACFYLPKTEKGRETIEKCGLLRFLYKFVSYECVSETITSRLSRLHGQLIRSTDAMEQVFLLSCIKDLAAEGIRIQVEKKLKSESCTSIQTEDK